MSILTFSDFLDCRRRAVKKGDILAVAKEGVLELALIHKVSRSGNLLGHQIYVKFGVEELHYVSHYKNKDGVIKSCTAHIIPRSRCSYSLIVTDLFYDHSLINRSEELIKEKNDNAGRKGL